MHLIEGAKWSDGEPFDADDVMFYWDDNVIDPNVTPLNGASPGDLRRRHHAREGRRLHRRSGPSRTPFPRQYLYAMAYGTFCPGPAHILKPQHPKYSENTYEQYKNAFPPNYMNIPVMGAWVPVEYRPDDIIVLRRNPYYWKVDEDGQPAALPRRAALPAVDLGRSRRAGGGRHRRLLQPRAAGELRRGAEARRPTRPRRRAWPSAPRIIGYSLYLNFSGNGWGEPDERGQAVRELNRNLDFRKAVTMAIDRAAARRVAGQGAVHRHLSRAACRRRPASTTRRRRSTIRTRPRRAPRR